MTIDGTPFAPHERTLPAMLQRQAREFGARPCVSIAGANWSHADIAGVAARRAAALRCAGVARGDRVALMCGNRAELLETVLGCGWLGAVAVPINTASMRPQIEYVLENGAISFSGSASTLMHDPRIIASYLGGSA